MLFKDPERLYREDVLLAKEAVTASLKLVDARMSMIEKIDKHPLSWPVATEYQRLKRAKTENAEEDKLFALAERKVQDDRKVKNDEAKAKAAARQRIFLQPKSQIRRIGIVFVLRSPFPLQLLCLIQ